MKNEILKAFDNVSEDNTINSYHRKLGVLFSAARRAGVLKVVCLIIDETIGHILDIIDEKCPVSDQSQS